MRKLMLVVAVMVAMVSFSCEGPNTAQTVPVGKYVGTISTFPGWSDVQVYEHEGNLIYQAGNGIAVVPKRSDK